MVSKWPLAGALALAIFTAACAPKRVPAATAAPGPKQNIVALLPERDGAGTGIVVKNQAGSLDLTQPNQAVRVERNDVAPSTPFGLDEPEVRRLFGAALDMVPAEELLFVLHFDGDAEVLNAQSEGLMGPILQAIRDRKSTAITVIGHTDTTGTPQYNYQLALKRAQHVAGRLQNQGVNESDLFVASHGDADLLVPTGRNAAEARNRRVEVIVR